MEYETERETGLDSDRRIYRLTASFPGRRGMPSLNRFLSEPHRDAPAPHQSGVIFRPVRNPVLGLRDLVPAALIEL